MREILFRGRGIQFRYWHEGELINTAGKIPPYMPMILETDERGNSSAYDVDPDTVGQFTGLTDKNGTKIFEGDIVEGHCHSRWRHDLQRCEIAYDRDGFEARHHVKCGEENHYYAYKVLFSKDVVVIGNIHDNPELLKV